MLTHYKGRPVAVIGNGPVGQTTALLLARWGIPSVVLDSRTERDAVGSKAICQQRDVLDIWSSIGAERLASDGLTWSTARTFYRDHELFSWSFSERGKSTLPPFVNVSQTHSEQVLDDLINKNPLIEVRWGHEVTGIEQTEQEVTLTCHTAQGPATVRAAYVVAAVGARGEKIRAALGVSFAGTTFEDRFLICDIKADLGSWEHERRFYFDPEWNPGRQVLIHPCPGQIFRIDWQVPAEFDLEAEAADGRLDARIRHVAGDTPYEIVWKSVYRFHARSVDQMRVGRVLLAGDSAHLVAPFGARGLNSGVADAENAAWKLAFVLQGWAPESLLDSYHHERHAAAQENLEVTSNTMRFLVPQNELEWQERRALLEAACSDATVHPRIDSGRLAEPFWYLNSPLTTANVDHPFRGRPERGCAPDAVPGVLIPDAEVRVPGRPEVTRMRQLVRDGVLALTAAEVDAEQVRNSLASTINAPVSVWALDQVDRDGTLREALSAKPGEVWLIRPDGHIGAVVEVRSADDLDHLNTAAQRILGS